MFLWIDPWVRKLWYALIDDNLTIIDAWILLQKQKSPTRYDQFDRANHILEFFEGMIEHNLINRVAMEKFWWGYFCALIVIWLSIPIAGYKATIAVNISEPDGKEYCFQKKIGR